MENEMDGTYGTDREIRNPNTISVGTNVGKKKYLKTGYIKMWISFN
jgi:hypothetical protein